jgi:hypothetical protein
MKHEIYRKIYWQFVKQFDRHVFWRVREQVSRRVNVRVRSSAFGLGNWQVERRVNDQLMDDFE